MKEMIDNILEHSNDSNMNYSDYFVNLIIDNKINSIDELDNYEKYEELDTKLANAYKRVKKNLYKYDSLDYKESLKLDELLNEYSSLENNEDKIKYIIKMFNILSYDPIFYKQTYYMIINEEI